LATAVILLIAAFVISEAHANRHQTHRRRATASTRWLLAR
jgi:hypothetical protein